jgi:hypothetical protein
MIILNAGDFALHCGNLTLYQIKDVREGESMDNLTFGVTMMVCGMGGTILTLWIFSLVMRLLGKIFPEKKEK